MKRIKKVKWGKRIWLVPLILLLVFAIFGGGTEGIEVKVTHPAISSITESIPANGIVRPLSEVKISPDVSGEIVEIYCREGDQVKKGELLLKIKPDIYLSILDQSTAILNGSKAQYRQQEATLRQAELAFDRCSRLYREGAVPLSEYEEAELQYMVAKRGLECAEYNILSATASVREAQENLSKTSVYAPMSGVISKMWVEKGERVVGTSQMAGTEMVRIADFSRMEVVADINENDIVKVELGDSAEIEAEALRGTRIHGIVTAIAPSASNMGYSSSQISSFEVRLLISDPVVELRPGMSASISIKTAEKTGIIALPLRCINPNGCIFVVGKDGTTVEERHIVTGIQDINHIEIIDGVTIDEEVVISPYEAITRSLTDNAKVFIDRD